MNNNNNLPFYKRKNSLSQNFESPKKERATDNISFYPIKLTDNQNSRNLSNYHFIQSKIPQLSQDKSYEHHSIEKQKKNLHFSYNNDIVPNEIGDQSYNQISLKSPNPLLNQKIKMTPSTTGYNTYNFGINEVKENSYLKKSEDNKSNIHEKLYLIRNDYNYMFADKEGIEEKRENERLKKLEYQKTLLKQIQEKKERTQAEKKKNLEIDLKYEKEFMMKIESNKNSINKKSKINEETNEKLVDSSSDNFRGENKKIIDELKTSSSKYNNLNKQNIVATDLENLKKISNNDYNITLDKDEKLINEKQNKKNLSLCNGCNSCVILPSIIEDICHKFWSEQLKLISQYSLKIDEIMKERDNAIKESMLLKEKLSLYNQLKIDNEKIKSSLGFVPFNGNLNQNIEKALTFKFDSSKINSDHIKQNEILSPKFVNPENIESKLKQETISLETNMNSDVIGYNDNSKQLKITVKNENLFKNDESFEKDIVLENVSKFLKIEPKQSSTKGDNSFFETWKSNSIKDINQRKLIQEKSIPIKVNNNIKIPENTFGNFRIEKNPKIDNKKAITEEKIETPILNNDNDIKYIRNNSSKLINLQKKKVDRIQLLKKNESFKEVSLISSVNQEIIAPLSLQERNILFKSKSFTDDPEKILLKTNPKNFLYQPNGVAEEFAKINKDDSKLEKKSENKEKNKQKAKINSYAEKIELMGVNFMNSPPLDLLSLKKSRKNKNNFNSAKSQKIDFNKPIYGVQSDYIGEVDIIPKELVASYDKFVYRD